jgi:hypothetical protein
MVKINKQYLVQTEYTNYIVNIKYNIQNFDKIRENDIKYLVSNSTSFEFNLGGSEYCANINIYSDDNTQADIGTFKYSKKCNVLNNLEPGIGTKHLLDTAMSLIMAMFPTIKSFYLTDTSKKSCHNLPDKPMRGVNLGFYYLLFNKNTWYGKKFNAELSNKIYQKQFNEYINILTSDNTKIEYGEFKYKILKHISEDELDKYNIELLYNKSDSYYDFFISLKTIINNETELCIFTSYFIELFMDFINKQLKYNFDNILNERWIINRFNLITIKMPLKPIDKINGGYKKYKYYI